jgi:hypothetical protein
MKAMYGNLTYSFSHESWTAGDERNVASGSKHGIYGAVLNFAGMAELAVPILIN